MSEETNTVRVAIAAPLAPELCERIAAVDPRVEVVVDQELLPPMRHPADFSGDPAWSRTPEQQAAYDALLDSAEVLYGIPDVNSQALARTVAANPDLRWVMTMAAGGGSQVVAAGLSEAELQRVTFTTSAGVHGVPLAEWAIFGVFCGTKELPRLQRQQREHAWPVRVVGRPIEGSTALVVGLGGIGQQVAKRCKALGMTVLGIKRSVSDVDNVDEVHTLDDLPSIVGRADHIIVTLPGTAQTEKLLNADVFAAAKRGVTVVNVGRGTCHRPGGAGGRPPLGPGRLRRSGRVRARAARDRLAAVGHGERAGQPALRWARPSRGRADLRPVLREPAGLSRRGADAQRRRRGAGVLT